MTASHTCPTSGQKLHGKSSLAGPSDYAEQSATGCGRYVPRTDFEMASRDKSLIRPVRLQSTAFALQACRWSECPTDSSGPVARARRYLFREHHPPVRNGRGKVEPSVELDVMEDICEICMFQVPDSIGRFAGYITHRTARGKL